MNYFNAKIINDFLTVFKDTKQEAYLYVYIPPPPPDPTPPPPPETFEWMGMCNILDVAEVFNDNKIDATYLFATKSILMNNAEIQNFNDIVNLSQKASYLFETKSYHFFRSDKTNPVFAITGK